MLYKENREELLNFTKNALNNDKTREKKSNESACFSQMRNGMDEDGKKS